MRGGLLIALGLASLATAPVQAQAPDWRTRVEAAVEAGEVVRARALLLAAAESGDAEAQHRLGELLRRGDGVDQDLAGAAAWYRRAAEQGHAPAQNALGRFYFEGVGRPADRAEALALLGAAAQSGAPEHGYDFALALEADGRTGEAALWYERGVAEGHVPAMTSLGVLALEGRGIERDAARALALFERAAEAGDARAQNNLGLMYARGEDVERDYERAAALFQAAADQGLAAAIGNLAVAKANGFGVPLDEAGAEALYQEAARSEGVNLEALLAEAGLPWPDRLSPLDPGPEAAGRDAIAAAAGDPVAQFSLGHRAARGEGRPVDLSAAARRFEASAEAGFAPAALCLGLLYARGLGVPQNYPEAYRWLVRAAAAGEPGAALLRDAVFARMSEGQRAEISSARVTETQD